MLACWFITPSQTAPMRIFQLAPFALKLRPKIPACGKIYFPLSCNLPLVSFSWMQWPTRAQILQNTMHRYATCLNPRRPLHRRPHPNAQDSRFAVCLCVCVCVCVRMLPDPGMAHVSQCSLSEPSLEQQAPVRLQRIHAYIQQSWRGDTRGFVTRRGSRCLGP